MSIAIAGAGIGLSNYGQGFGAGSPRIDTAAQAALAAQKPTAAQAGQPAAGGALAYAADPMLGPAVTVEISPQGRSAYEDSEKDKKVGETEAAQECQTCKNRKYQDGSDDTGVSYQSPTHIAPGNAAGAVAAHEGEHVAHEQAKAALEDRKVISQSVSIHTSVCPECGKTYVSGGETRTTTASKPKQPKIEKARPADAA